MKKMKDILTVEHLSGGYGSIHILYDISLHLGKQEIVTIIGPNGSGKSTFLKVVFGLATLYDGRIVYDSQDVTGFRTDQLVKMGISYVPQVENVFPNLTIRENLEIGAYRIDDDISDDMEFVFSIFPELKRRQYDLTATLSGGQRQMLALGRALMGRPKLLLLDEPTAALSPAYIKLILEKIRELRDNGVSILLVEQNARSALLSSDRGYIFASGRVVHEARAKSLLTDPKVNEYFLGVVSE